MTRTTEEVRGAIEKGIAIALLIATMIKVGATILVSPEFSGKIIRYVHDTDGRILSLLADLNSLNFNIICVYAPNTVSDRGDFSCIYSELDRLHIKSDFRADKCCLSALKSDFCLVDVFRKQNPKAISFTWSNKDFSQASRLNCFYISSSLLQSVRGNKCFPCSLSDHDF
ncbi:unnamed protein product, partial [Porites lobata]